MKRFRPCERRCDPLGRGLAPDEPVPGHSVLNVVNEIKLSFSSLISLASQYRIFYHLSFPVMLRASQSLRKQLQVIGEVALGTEWAKEIMEVAVEKVPSLIPHTAYVALQYDFFFYQQVFTNNIKRPRISGTKGRRHG